jgi:hypothetical protein
MSDANSPDHSPTDPSKATAWDSVTDRELDAALSNAAALASDLVEELGKPETTPQAVTPNPLEDPRSDLDAELGQLADLTQRAATELDTAARPVARAAAVPDFMSEFMEPPNEAPAPPGSAESIAPAPIPEPEPVGAASSASPAPVGVVGGVINITIPAGKLRKQAEANAVTPPEPPGPPRPSLTERALNPIAAGLELADKPFSKLNGRARTVLGWVALALLAVAAILVKYRLR